MPRDEPALTSTPNGVPDGGASPPPGPFLIAYALLYVCWGSTYLAIRIAVETWPPLLMAATRFTLAGGALYAVLRARGVAAPTRKNWGAALLVGGMLLAVGNGTVCWAEQWVPSGVVALIIASTPLWMTVLPWVTRRASAPRPLVAAGVLLGLGGVTILLSARHAGGLGDRGGPAWAPAMLLLATLSWSVGSLWSRRLPLPASPFLSTAMQMLAGGALLFVISGARGEFHAMSAALFAPRPILSLLFLIVFGSIAGFGSYVWLLRHATPARASTYAFVTPLIAVVLGWAIAGESTGPRTFVAAALIVSSVAAVVMGSGRSRRT